MVGTSIQVAGAAVVALALVDIFLTVLHARGDAGLVSTRLNRAVWLAIRSVSRAAGKRRETVRGYAGPLALVLTVSLWITLVTLGFALIAWPDLGHGIRARGPADRTFAMAVAYSGSALTTLGPGDIVPVSASARVLAFVDSLIGISLVTLSLTYFLSIYSALIRRNAFAMEMNYMTARTGDAAELLVRIGSKGEFGGTARGELAAIARELLTLLQTHHAYPVVNLFHQADVAMAPARVALVALDTASLVRSALDRERHGEFIDCAAVEVLWDGGIKLLIETGRDILTETDRAAADPPNADAWRARYRAARERLAAAGFAVEPDRARGEASYARQRRRWDAHVRAFAAYRGQDWADIDPVGSDAEAGGER